MVHVILPDNRSLYGDALSSMFRDRKSTFVDRLRWDVPVVDGQYEMDQFDTDEAVYLVATDPNAQRHMGSVRLLPTTAAHLLGDVFPELCEAAPPRGDDVWEITRLCTASSLPKDDAKKVRGLLKMALVEFALLYGIERYTLMTHLAYLSRLLASGWHAEPLGLPREVGGEQVGAMVINITPATLQLFRDRAGTRRPVLQFVYPAQTAA